MQNLQKILKKINNVSVENMQSNNGNDIPNQFIVRVDNFAIFQSYKAIIAVVDNITGQVWIDKYYWNYSKTTGKYRNIFLGEDKKETEEKIKDGTYILTDLN